MRQKLVGISILFVLSSVSSSLLHAATIGTFDSSRGGAANLVDGAITSLARASLAVNFPDATIASAPTLTPSFLAGLDLLIVSSARDGSSGISPLSAAEQAALFDFVLAGGSAMLLAEVYVDDASAQSLVGTFGMSVVDDGLIGLQPGTIQNPGHPVFDGPYGVQPFVAVYGAGVFTDLGPYANSLATMDANGLPIIATIESGVLGPGSGRVFIMADATPFADPIAQGYFAESEVVFLNTVHYLMVPEPATGLLLTMAMFILAGWKYRLRGV